MKLQTADLTFYSNRSMFDYLLNGSRYNYLHFIINGVYLGYSEASIHAFIERVIVLQKAGNGDIMAFNVGTPFEGTGFMPSPDEVMNMTAFEIEEEIEKNRYALKTFHEDAMCSYNTIDEDHLWEVMDNDDDFVEKVLRTAWNFFKSFDYQGTAIKRTWHKYQELQVRAQRAISRQ